MYPILYKLSLAPLSSCDTHADFFAILELFLKIQNQFPAFSVDLEKNETFLDEIFLHGKYTNFQNGQFNYLQNISEAEFIQWKTYLAEIKNNKKINFFTEQLFNENISLNYFKIQTERYQLKSLKKCCFFTLSENLVSVQKIDHLPLPKLLKENLTEFAKQHAIPAHRK